MSHPSAQPSWILVRSQQVKFISFLADLSSSISLVHMVNNFESTCLERARGMDIERERERDRDRDVHILDRNMSGMKTSRYISVNVICKDHRVKK